MLKKKRRTTVISYILLILISLFSNAKEYRDSLPITDRGVLSTSNEIYLFIEDRVGGISEVAKLLADHSISIKNISIIHNREFEDGVLRLETYEAEDKKKALTLLRENGFMIREKR